MARSDVVSGALSWRVQAAVSAIAVALAAMHVLTRYRLDTIALALVVLAVQRVYLLLFPA